MHILKWYGLLTLAGLALGFTAHVITATPETVSGTIRRKARVNVCRALESFFRVIARHSRKLADACAICPNCGRNKYTAKPCTRKPSGPFVSPASVRVLVVSAYREFWNDEPATARATVPAATERTETE